MTKMTTKTVNVYIYTLAHYNENTRQIENTQEIRKPFDSTDRQFRKLLADTHPKLSVLKVTEKEERVSLPTELFYKYAKEYAENEKQFIE